MRSGWAGLLLCVLCLARLGGCELRQLDRFRYLASFPLKDDVKLSCNADLMVKYVPAAVARWVKDKESVLGKDRLSVDDSHTLHIRALQPEDSGLYACVVAFPGGTEVISSEIMLSAGGKNQQFVSWLKHKGSLGGARNVWALSAVCCVIIGLLWTICILVMCKRKRRSRDAEDQRGGRRRGSSSDEDGDEDGSASETDELIKKKKEKKEEKKKPKKGTKKGKRK
ncbi:hypothetical protein Bbelb_221860 [Branchiostoma belcheri]|nr:hypothetical protein Bbelb_221860 [Branchiostoma belcheri]